MLGLPKSTEMNKMLPKKAIYAKFQMNNAAKEKVDADISRITIVNEISPARVNLAEGETVKSFFVIHVALKRREFSEATIAMVSKLLPQNILMVLSYGEEAKLAVYRTKLLQTQWMPKDEVSVQLKGLDLDAAWENIIIQIGGIQMQQGNTLDQQIALDEKRAKLEKEIARLEKLARAEKQPKKKFELVQQIAKIKEKTSNEDKLL